MGWLRSFLEAAEHKMDSKKTLVQVVDLLENRWMKKALLLFSLLEDQATWHGRDGRKSLHA